MTDPAQYRVVFDVSQKPFEWWFPAFGLLFIVLGCAYVWLSRRFQWHYSRLFAGFFIGFACLWTLAALAATLPEYLDLRSAIKEGRASVVEGYVTNFRPMPYQGHQDECFSVSEKTFCYSDYGVTAGFNNSTSHGGPIREGLQVRISYIEGTIIRLEIKSDVLPSAEQRAATAEGAKKGWQQQMENDPTMDRMNLGFSISALFMTAWWNLQPKRFMKFWLKPPYKPLTIALFRVFFAANVLGALSYVFGLVRHRHRDWSEYGDVAKIAAIGIAIIFVMVNLSEWMNRGRTNPDDFNSPGAP